MCKLSKILAILLICFFYNESIKGASPISFTNNNLKVIEITPDKNTGLNMIFVVDNVSNVSISYDSGVNEPSVWYKYSNLGGGYAEELTGIEQSGSVSTMNNIIGDMGYIIETGDNRYYFWLVDYSNHKMTLNNLFISSQKECDTAYLTVDGYGEPIKYFTINGQQRELDRKIELSYNSLEWDSEAKLWNQVECLKLLEDFSSEITIMPSPLCDTEFELRGDRFLRDWGLEISAISDLYRTISVDVRTEAIQNNLESEEDKSNKISLSDNSGLGGSAPADISFYAYVTDAVAHHEWQMSSDEEFEQIIYRFNQQDLDYIFNEEGTFYLRYIGSNYEGSCEVYSDIYVVNIGASELKCPNAFSPGVTEGVNDEWKVGYRSIIEFECSIFNRWGVEMYHFTDPTLGWDGKYNDKLVKPGVYYYVIQALGADGKKYKLSGDINIIRYNEQGGSTDNNNSME